MSNLNTILNALEASRNTRVIKARPAIKETVTGPKTVYDIKCTDGVTYRVFAQGRKVGGILAPNQMAHTLEYQVIPQGGGEPYWYGDTYLSLLVG